MNPLEITLIIIGIIIILISCIIVDKSQKAVLPAGTALTLESNLTQAAERKLQDKMDELMTQVSEEVIIKTDDTLSKISNEKIMAINEFSEQLLEKISQNHEEVIFLYNMLNDKEKELKAAVREIDSSKKKVQEIMEAKAKNKDAQDGKNPSTQNAPKPASQASGMKRNEQKSQKNKTLNNEPENDQADDNNNTRILELYSQGLSVMEVSKMLNLGQGEVKLVIDLYKSKK